MKIEYTPTHYRREHNASETTQAPFLATFKAIRNKLGQKRHRYSVYSLSFLSFLIDLVVYSFYAFRFIDSL